MSVREPAARLYAAATHHHPCRTNDRQCGNAHRWDTPDTADAVEIHTLSNPSNRVNPLPGAPAWTVHASWLHLVNVAANLCLAVDVVHRVDAVVGDFQERNILVSDDIGGL